MTSIKQDLAIVDSSEKSTLLLCSFFENVFYLVNAIIFIKQYLRAVFLKHF